MKNAVSDRVMEWSRSHIPRGRLGGVVGDFYGPGGKPEVAEEDLPLFGPYLLWKWHPPGGASLGTSFLQSQRHRLTPDEREYIEQAIAQPWSFLIVTAVKPGESIGLRDAFTGREVEVREVLASRAVQVRDIVFGQFVRIDGVYSLECLGSMRLPPGAIATVIEMREALEEKAGVRPVTDADLNRLGDGLRLRYFKMVERIRTPPQLTNTDGEPLELHTLSYRLTVTPEQAFVALSPLALPAQQDGLGENTFDANGALQTVEFVWAKRGNKQHRSWDNTILAHLSIKGARLEAEVNSAGRARRLRAQIKKRLGAGAIFESDHLRSAEALLAAARKAPEPEEEPSPELAEMERRMREQHMLEWTGTELPILRGKTPRQALLEPDGREIVISLLTEWERRDPAGVAVARQALGLAPDL
ncbi:MAG TPA: hypothetical protein VN515_07720 [Terriglobales bacterium]|nr:hypothetical protein [Terriglobales bacterium]